MANFQVKAKNGTSFVTENDSLAKSLRNQGHEVVEVGDDEIAAPAKRAPAKRAPAKASKSKAAPAAAEGSAEEPAAEQPEADTAPSGE